MFLVINNYHYFQKQGHYWVMQYTLFNENLQYSTLTRLTHISLREQLNLTEKVGTNGCHDHWGCPWFVSFILGIENQNLKWTCMCKNILYRCMIARQKEDVPSCVSLFIQWMLNFAWPQRGKTTLYRYHPVFAWPHLGRTTLYRYHPVFVWP